jgi:Fe-S cluster biogenesis protein NfuA
MVDLGFRMHAERTPNPNSIKWVLGDPVAEAGIAAHFDAPVGDAVSPLAARLFAVRGITGVFFASNFITVSKEDGLDWQDIAQELVDAIKAHVDSGQASTGPEYQQASSGESGEIEAKILEILDAEIRPAVAMDGGDVVFAGFHDGRVELYLQGACAGCPSSTATLKFGIEARLREEIPEITEVVAL